MPMPFSDAYDVLGFDVSLPGRCVGRFALAAGVGHHVGVVTERVYFGARVRRPVAVCSNPHVVNLLKRRAVG